MSREELGWAIMSHIRANQVLTDMLDDAAAGLLGINRTDARALDVIDQKGRITAGELSRELRMSTGAVTTIVDRLERAGYARRLPDPEDRRRVLIEVMPIVRENAAKIYGTHEDVFAAYDDWTDEELHAVLRFQEFSRAWLEEHLETVEELRRQQQQPRPNAVRAGRRRKND